MTHTFYVLPRQLINRGQIALQDSLAELNARLQQGGIRIGLQQAPAIEVLQSIQGIEKIESIDTQHFMLFCNTDFDTTAFTRQAVEQNWGLTELSPQTRSLEQVFIDITCNEAGDKEAAA